MQTHLKIVTTVLFARFFLKCILNSEVNFKFNTWLGGNSTVGHLEREIDPKKKPMKNVLNTRFKKTARIRAKL